MSMKDLVTTLLFFVCPRTVHLPLLLVIAFCRDTSYCYNNMKSK